MFAFMVFLPPVMKALAGEIRAAEAMFRKQCSAEQSQWPPWSHGRRVKECVEHMVATKVAREVIVPFDVTLKHFRYPGILSTHHLGAFLWLSAGLAQFGLSRAGPAERRRHRLVGYIFLLSAILIAVGFIQIVWHNLFAAYDYHALFPHEVSLPSRAEYLMTVGIHSSLQLWFLFTAGKAWAAAGRRRFEEHRTWIVRHMASGGWVVVMRVIISLSQGVIYTAMRLGWAPVGGALKHDLFGISAGLGVLVSFATAELYLLTSLRSMDASMAVVRTTVAA